jgi:hypothetical protein
MRSKILPFSNVILYLLVFISSLFTPFDPDLGWELKYGEFFVKYHQILSTNIFSTILPHFYWINHSWGADVILYTIFIFFGFFGLTIAGAMLITLIFFFISKAAKLSIIQKAILFPILLYLESPFSSGSFRPELMSLFLLSILIYLISEYENGGKRKIYFTIPLLLLWANIHGEFILGLGIFLLWIILYFIKLKITIDSVNKKQQFFLLGSVFVASCLAVLVNPFGIGVYIESFTHFFNPNLQYIIGWHPLPLFSSDWWMLIIVGILFFISIRIAIVQDAFFDNLPFIIIAMLLFLFSFFSRRYIWPFYYIIVPFLALLIDRLHLKKKRHQNAVALTVVILMAIVIVIIKSPFNQYTTMSWDTYCNVRLCSPKAAHYLITHHLNTNPHLLTQYDLGGWLIWKYYPQIKPTIDGRMTLWIGQNGYNPLRNYIYYEQNLKDIDTSNYTVVFTSLDEPFVGRLIQLSKEGKWKIAYLDRRTAIFVRE